MTIVDLPALGTDLVPRAAEPQSGKDFSSDQEEIGRAHV